MTTTKAGLVIAALPSVSAHAADTSIDVTVVNGQQQARFSIGDSKCSLVGEVIQCKRVLVASN